MIVHAGPQVAPDTTGLLHFFDRHLQQASGMAFLPVVRMGTYAPDAADFQRGSGAISDLPHEDMDRRNNLAIFEGGDRDVVLRSTAF